MSSAVTSLGSRVWQTLMTPLPILMATALLVVSVSLPWFRLGPLLTLTVGLALMGLMVAGSLQGRVVVGAARPNYLGSSMLWNWPCFWRGMWRGVSWPVRQVSYIQNRLQPLIGGRGIIRRFP
jgi:hypothetical protein